jgi:hypothetical protein
MIYTVSYLIHSVIYDQAATSVDPDQMVRMCQLIWINAGHTRDKPVSLSKTLIDSGQEVINVLQQI